ncbi:thiol-activated cytolysin [Aquimarina sp. MAR_2010_214]|uniref:thiol-activated cytolysin family protein n=1 Tax=Aquimarina sp. MAR_2010_214 TaxID=1250026 RepID=UPI000C70D3A0|nr:thiol-activated cytolysin family protein [Aquimarina sp. MAR_2010_214]PKV48384.1 thiol-activated cytolysin [Aquimarina sp. MAR_2010_214]
MRTNKPSFLRKYRAIAFTGLFLGGLISCQNDDLTNNTITSNLEAREQYLNEDIPDGISNFVIKEQYSTDSNAKTKEEENCNTKTFSFDQTDSDFFLLDGNTSIQWPGNLLGSRSIQEGAPWVVSIDGEDRNPIEIRINAVTGIIDSTYRKIKAPTPSLVQHNLNAILNTFQVNHGKFPAKFAVSIKRIHNEQQLQAALGAGYSGPSVDISGQLGINFNEQKTRYAVKLIQTYFTASVTPKEGIIGEKGWLNKNVDPRRLKKYGVTDFENVSADKANPSAFVESVTYGRLYTMIYESTERASDVKAALKFAYKGVGSANAEMNVKHKKIFRSANVIVRQLGGNASDGIASSLAAFANNLDEVIALLKKGAEVSQENPGYPISYKVNYAQNNRPFKVTQNIKYKVKTCDLVDYETIRLDPIDVALYGGSDHGTSGAELFGKLYVEKYNKDNNKWYSVGKKIYWGRYNNQELDYFPLDGVKKEIAKGEVIDFKVKTGSGERFRVVSRVGECDDKCIVLTDGTRFIDYEYNTTTKKWVDVEKHNKAVSNYTIGESFGKKTWNGARSKVEGGGDVYLDYYTWIIDN